jgi:hypothetical protein
MKLRPTTQNRPTKRESRGLSEPTRAQIQRERVQVWRRVVALPSLRPGLRRLGRDYSRDLRPSEWGSGVKLHGNNLDLPMYRVEADEGYNVRSHLMERCRLSVISAYGYAWHERTSAPHKRMLRSSRRVEYAQHY